MTRLADVESDLLDQPAAPEMLANRVFDADQQITNMQPTARRGLAADLPEELVISIARCLDWLDFVRSARVCRHWRYSVINCSHLWAYLDLYDTGRHALRILPKLLPLSGNSSLDLRVWFLNDDEYSNNIPMLCSQLRPHVHRLRALTVRSRRRSNYTPLFTLLQGGATMLSYLDVSHDHREYVVFESPPSSPSPLAPNLTCVNWGSHPVPNAPTSLSNLTHLRIDPSSTTVGHIFSLFPRVQTLHLDMFSSTRGVQVLPAAHPLVTLTLSVRHIEKSPYHMSWADLQPLGFGRVARLHLYQYASTAVIYACLSLQWLLTSVTIDYDDLVDASFVHRNSHAECRMTDLAPSRGKTWSMMRVMRETDWLRALVSFTLSMALSVTQKRPSLLLPRGRLPALRDFSLICGNEGLKSDGKVERWGTLLDADIMATCGLLEAPQLRVMRLLARTPRHSGDGRIISPAALARFISSHVQVDGARVPLLKISTFLQFDDDALGLAALCAEVDTIEHWL